MPVILFFNPQGWAGPAFLSSESSTAWKSWRTTLLNQPPITFIQAIRLILMKSITIIQMTLFEIEKTTTIQFILQIFIFKQIKRLSSFLILLLIHKTDGLMTSEQPLTCSQKYFNPLVLMVRNLINSSISSPEYRCDMSLNTLLLKGSYYSVKSNKQTRAFYFNLKALFRGEMIQTSSLFWLH